MPVEVLQKMTRTVVALPNTEPLHALIRRELGRELRRIREEDRDGLTHQEVGDKAGIHRRTVGNCERGDNTNIDNYIKLAQALDVDWGWLNSQVMALLSVRAGEPSAGKERPTG